jgi:C4-dicarboxylate-specific signal transduction histidine kinase
MSESVSYIKRALEQAVTNPNFEPVPRAESDIEPEIPDRVKKELYTKAMEEVSGILIHELAPTIGVLGAELAKVLPEYEMSSAKTSVDRLVKKLEAIAELKRAASAPRLQELDLSTLIKTLVEASGSTSISLQGPAPFVITGDHNLLSLALSNGLRNALDAVAGQEESPTPVVMNWGESDLEYWVSILDCGRGILGPPEGAFNIGTTNKSGHLGFGLAIARQAMNSLAGTVRLVNSKSSGAIFEVRWCK